MNVVTVIYNWSFSQDNGEQFSKYTVGDFNVKSITESYDGKLHYCYVMFEDGSSKKVFNINSITYEPK